MYSIHLFTESKRAPAINGIPDVTTMRIQDDLIDTDYAFVELSKQWVLCFAEISNVST